MDGKNKRQKRDIGRMEGMDSNIGGGGREGGEEWVKFGRGAKGNSWTTMTEPERMGGQCPADRLIPSPPPNR